MRTSTLRTMCIGAALLIREIGMAYPSSHAPFPPGTEPRMVPINKCMSVGKNDPVGSTAPPTRLFVRSQSSLSPLVRIQRAEEGWTVAVLDRNGVPLLTPPARNDMASDLHAVYSADLNRDGRPDFLVNTWSGGCGLASVVSATTFLLSDGEKYRAQSFCSFDFRPEDIVKFAADGPSYFIHSDVMGNGDEKTRDGRDHNFWVFQIFRIDGPRLIRANGDDPRFPKWVWYTFNDNHRETNLLTPRQKHRILERRRQENGPR